MLIAPPSRDPRLLALVCLSATAGAACAPAARYPAPGEPGPVVTAAGDTIPEGPDREAFMAGYRAGYDRAREVGGPYGWSVLGGAIGGAVTTVALPLSLIGGYWFLPFAVGGIALIRGVAAVDRIEPLTDLPPPVAEQGAVSQAGYREGYVRGLRLQPRKETAMGVFIGLLWGLGILGKALST